MSGLPDIDIAPEVVCLRLRSILARIAQQPENMGIVMIPVGPQDVHAIGIAERVVRRMFVPESEAFHQQHDVSPDPA